MPTSQLDAIIKKIEDERRARPWHKKVRDTIVHDFWPYYRDKSTILPMATAMAFAAAVALGASALTTEIKENIGDVTGEVSGSLENVIEQTAPGLPSSVAMTFPGLDRQ